MEFRRALLKAADEAGVSGVDMFRLRLASRLPRVREALEEECCEHLCAQGLLQPQAGAAIDWSGLIEALKELLPLILEFIKALLSFF